MAKVKEKTLLKIEDYLVRQTAIQGHAEIRVVMEDLRRETQLSLVTIYKALDSLVEMGKLEVVSNGRRRSPRHYRYVSLEQARSETPPEDLAGLIRTIEDMMREMAMKDKVIEALRVRVATFEAQETQVLYRLQLKEEDVEIVIRKTNKDFKEGWL